MDTFVKFVVDDRTAFGINPDKMQTVLRVDHAQKGGLVTIGREGGKPIGENRSLLGAARGEVDLLAEVVQIACVRWRPL